MISFRWLPIFILGTCAGYGLARFFHPEQQPMEVAQPEVAIVTASKQPGQLITPTQEALPQPVREPQSLAPPEPEAAYMAWIREAVAKREFSTALDLLAEAGRQFGISAPRLILRAEIQQLRKDLKGARATLHQALAVDPAMAEQIYPLLRAVVTALMRMKKSALTFDEKVQILSQEIIDDPGFAAYYTLLGRLYYRHESYADAITNLEYALQLDHTQTALLSPLITAARERLANPGLIELPISSHGRTLDVDVRLNDAPQPFRFILDTGASYTAISSRTAQRLGIVISQELPVIQVSTANGMVKVPLITLNAVNLQGALVEQVPAIVLSELNGFDGLLGLSFLNHFNIDINQDEGKLFLLKPSTD